MGQGDAAIYERRRPVPVDDGPGSVEEVQAALDAAGSRRLRWVAPPPDDVDHPSDLLDVATAPG